MSDRQIYHLRRIGPPASTPSAVDIMDFERVTYLIGRSPTMVDYVIDSSDTMKSMFISRCHARVVRQTENKYKLFDDSLNGIFVNNVKIAGNCVLQEGDRVTFGHPVGSRLPVGMRVRQPDSEYQFMFEKCSCVRATRDSSIQVKEKTTEGSKLQRQDIEPFQQPNPGEPGFATDSRMKEVKINQRIEVVEQREMNATKGDLISDNQSEKNTEYTEMHKLKINQDSEILEPREVNNSIGSLIPDKQSEKGAEYTEMHELKIIQDSEIVESREVNGCIGNMIPDNRPGKDAEYIERHELEVNQYSEVLEPREVNSIIGNMIPDKQIGKGSKYTDGAILPVEVTDSLSNLIHDKQTEDVSTRSEMQELKINHDSELREVHRRIVDSVSENMTESSVRTNSIGITGTEQSVGKLHKSCSTVVDILDKTECKNSYESTIANHKVCSQSIVDKTEIFRTESELKAEESGNDCTFMSEHCAKLMCGDLVKATNMNNNSALGPEEYSFTASEVDKNDQSCEIKAEDISHSPLMQEAQKIYSLVKDISKSLNQTQNGEKECSNFKESSGIQQFIERQKVCMSDVSIQTTQKLICDSSFDPVSENNISKQDVIIQTSQVDILPIDSGHYGSLRKTNTVGTDHESVPSSQSSITEREVADVNISDDNFCSSVDTDVSDVSEAQTIVVEICQQGCINNDVVNENLSNSVDSKSGETQNDHLLSEKLQDEYQCERNISENEICCFAGNGPENKKTKEHVQTGSDKCMKREHESGLSLVLRDSAGVDENKHIIMSTEKVIEEMETHTQDTAVSDRNIEDDNKISAESPNSDRECAANVHVLQNTATLKAVNVIRTETETCHTDMESEDDDSINDHECILILTNRTSKDTFDESEVETKDSQSENTDFPNLVLSDSIEYDWTSEYETENDSLDESEESENVRVVESVQKSESVIDDNERKAKDDLNNFDLALLEPLHLKNSNGSEIESENEGELTAQSNHKWDKRVQMGEDENENKIEQDHTVKTKSDREYQLMSDVTAEVTNRITTASTQSGRHAPKAGENKIQIVTECSETEKPTALVASCLGQEITDIDGSALIDFDHTKYSADRKSVEVELEQLEAGNEKAELLQVSPSMYEDVDNKLELASNFNAESEHKCEQRLLAGGSEQPEVNEMSDTSNLEQNRPISILNSSVACKNSNFYSDSFDQKTMEEEGKEWDKSEMKMKNTDVHVGGDVAEDLTEANFGEQKEWLKEDIQMNDSENTSYKSKQFPAFSCKDSIAAFAESNENEIAKNSDNDAEIQAEKLDLDTDCSEVNEAENYQCDSEYDNKSSGRRYIFSANEFPLERRTATETCLPATISYNYSRCCTHEEETFNFKSPNKVIQSQDSCMACNRHVASYASSEEDSFVYPESEKSFSLETGLEVIGLSILKSNIETENTSNVCRRCHTHETDSIQTMIEKDSGQETNVLVKEDSILNDSSDKCNNRTVTDFSRSKGKISEAADEKSELKVSRQLADSLECKSVMATEEVRVPVNNKRKMPCRDEDSDEELCLPTKKISCDYKESGILSSLDGSPTLKGTNCSNQRAEEMKNNLLNFFFIRQKYNELKSRSPTKVRKQTLRRLVKCFFKQFPTKKMYKLVSSHVNSSPWNCSVDANYKLHHDNQSVHKEEKLTCRPKVQDTNEIESLELDRAELASAVSSPTKLQQQRFHHFEIEDCGNPSCKDTDTNEENSEVRVREDSSGICDDSLSDDHNQLAENKNTDLLNTSDTTDEKVPEGNENRYEDSGSHYQSAPMQEALTGDEIKDICETEIDVSLDDNDKRFDPCIDAGFVSGKESQDTESNDLILGNVAVARPSDTSMVDTSVCMNDSDLDTGYDFLLKTASKVVCSQQNCGSNGNLNNKILHDDGAISTDVVVSAHDTNWNNDHIIFHSTSDERKDKVEENSNSSSNYHLKQCKQLDLMTKTDSSKNGLLCDHRNSTDGDTRKRDNSKRKDGSSENHDDGINGCYYMARNVNKFTTVRDCHRRNSANPNNNIKNFRDKHFEFDKSSVLLNDSHNEDIVENSGDDNTCSEADGQEYAVDLSQLQDISQNANSAFEIKDKALNNNKAVEQKQPLEDLSCRFSDTDDDDNFVSPVIDFSHLDEDDDIQCGQLEEKCDEKLTDCAPNSTLDFELVEDTGISKDIGTGKEAVCHSETENSAETKDDESVAPDWGDCFVHESVETDNHSHDAAVICQMNTEQKDDDEEEFSPDVDLQFKDDDDDDDANSHEEEDEMPFLGDSDEDSSLADNNAKSSCNSSPTFPKQSTSYFHAKECDYEISKDAEYTSDDDNETGNLKNSVAHNYAEDKIRTPAKRKWNFSEVLSPKIARYNNKDICVPETLSVAPASEKDTYFKTPKLNSGIKSNRMDTPVNKEIAVQSPNDFCSTQVLCSSHQPDLDELSASQMTTVARQLEFKAVDRSKTSAMRNKAKEMLARLKAKKDQHEKDKCQTAASYEDIDHKTSSQERQSSIPSARSGAEVSLMKDEENMQSVEKVIRELKRAFETSSLRHNTRIQAWRDELSSIEQKLKVPKTIIAVVGGTGEGKSSLMNALLDHRSVLPTSGIRACTAVVVEVVHNAASDMFEADIEFLKQKEWFEELQVLIQDLTSRYGKIRKGTPPDASSDTYVSFCKVKAVYGKIDKFEVLSRMTAITRCLGTTKTVRSNDPEEFRQKVEKYIQTKDHNAGMQYWPIVKHVRLRMPNCDVCSSGTVLVDLPGVRDSNAARDKIAKEYLKNCTAVWVVSGIHRAIDDKTAKTLLGENFRRQLLMDGQYGSVAFICSKSDVLVPSEIINNLRLEAETGAIESKTAEMEQEKGSLRRESRSCQKDIGTFSQQVKTWQKEVEEIRSTLEDISSLLDSNNVDSQQSEDQVVVEELKEEMKTKEDQIREAEESIAEKEEKVEQCNRQMNEIENKLVTERKEIAAICARARNEYAKTEIKKDFKAGLKEMKRQAGAEVNDEADDYDDDDDDNEDGSSADNLRVFCCSATEYQKMKNLLTDDGPSQVFNDIADTEVPALRNYVHEMTSVRKKQWVERLIRNLGGFVFDLYHYMADRMTMSSSCRLNAESTIDVFVEKCRSSLGTVIEKLSTDIEDSFDSSIKTKLDEGSKNAENEASNTCSLWGASHNRETARESATGRKSVGLHFSTYRATIYREGVFKSPTYGQINFNEDLTDPIYRCLTVVWDRVFSGSLWKLLAKLKETVLRRLQEFCREICLELSQLGVPEERGARVCSHLLGSATNKLNEMVAEMKGVVTEKQREISRIVTPCVQESLSQTYNICAGESGEGMFNRIKDILSRGINEKKPSMFQAACEELMAELLDLKEELIQSVRAVTNTLLMDLKAVFEPLWEAPSNYKNLQANLKQPLFEACSAVRDIYRQAGLANTEERTNLTVAIPQSESNTVAVPSDCLPTVGSLPDKAIVSVVKKSASCTVLALPSAASTPSCHAVSLLTGQRYIQESGNRPGLGTVQTSRIQIKQEPDVIDRRDRNPHGQGSIKVVQVKQESMEYTCAELDANVPIAGFGQQTIQSLSEGKLELLPIETVPPSQPALNSRVPASSPYLAKTSQTLQKAGGNLSNQRNSPVQVTTKKVVGSRHKSVEKSAKNLKEVSSQSQNRKSASPKQKETPKSAKKVKRFHDRLQNLSQSLDSPPDKETDSVTGSVKSLSVVSANECQAGFSDRGKCPVSAKASLTRTYRREMTPSPEKTFLKEASLFGAKLSNRIKRNSSASAEKPNDSSDSIRTSGMDLNKTSSNCGPVFSTESDKASDLIPKSRREASAEKDNGKDKPRKRRTVRMSLSLSQRGTPQKNDNQSESVPRSPSSIKTEPEDDGYFARRKKPKLSGFIDLTSDDSD